MRAFAAASSRRSSLTDLESGLGHGSQARISDSERKGPPVFEVVVRAVTALIPAFDVLPARIRREKYASRSQAVEQISKHARKFPGRNVEERRVCKYTVELGCG